MPLAEIELPRLTAPTPRDVSAFLREADLRLELLLALADGYGSREQHAKHFDPGKAIGYAD